MSGRKNKLFKFRSKYDEKSVPADSPTSFDDEWEDDPKSKPSSSWSPWALVVSVLVVLSILVTAVAYAKGVDIRAVILQKGGADENTALPVHAVLSLRDEREVPDKKSQEKAKSPQTDTNTKTDTNTNKKPKEKTDTREANKIDKAKDIATGDKVKGMSDPSQKKESEIMEDVNQQIEKIREMKSKQHIVIETSEAAQKEIKVLQDLLRILLPMRYGPEPYIVQMALKFPDVMKPIHSNWTVTVPQVDFIDIKLAPCKYVPYSVFYFLENYVEQFKGGSFHRRAGHVLQAQVSGGNRVQPLAFQEYNKEYPHKQYTLGYAGRPSSAHAFYISTQNNSENHGPGSQGSKTEADCIVGEILNAKGIETVKRMNKQPGAGKGSGFISDSKNFIRIQGLDLKSNKQSKG